ncbi:tRNA methyltransferase complex GCD14 subunit-domain-containing protein [Mycena rosella]|uniref:tRNA (adenine(58)-N(1))-methyltransferase catalytic subunit TRM61 n=1 Tax=Mycena rosella TaxID=1033263 RepID=A0AAD7DXA4_MYCRO|nr:tRNA methyltransferase complex GCD14 subunit-domain-containing protein [Mycena rosella]
MWSTAREIAAGDTVIIWLTRDVIQPLVITPGKDFNSKFGNYRHSDFIGMPFGSKVGSRSGKGFIHILRPTPELWTMALPHRTQILYIADISFITSYLDIRRGSRVIEAGTGSGSFSHSVARSIGPSGHLWSYEFHEVRAKKAREEFAQHGMSDIVTLTHQNVCKDGFNLTDAADSVFLDLPAPWDAIEHAKQALRKDRTTRICCFSPCMEQVLRTVSALNDAGFTGVLRVALDKPNLTGLVHRYYNVRNAAAITRRGPGPRPPVRRGGPGQAQKSGGNPRNKTSPANRCRPKESREPPRRKTQTG